MELLSILSARRKQNLGPGIQALETMVTESVLTECPQGRGSPQTPHQRPGSVSCHTCHLIQPTVWKQKLGMTFSNSKKVDSMSIAII